VWRASISWVAARLVVPPARLPSALGRGGATSPRSISMADEPSRRPSPARGYGRAGCRAVQQRRSQTEEASMAETTHDAERVMANIRELNEQILEAGRSAGLDFLDAYERTLRTFADYQDKLADASQSDGLTQMMKAQANFTRDVVSAVSEVSRSTLKK
jgi:hypothetical protein